MLPTQTIYRTTNCEVWVLCSQWSHTRGNKSQKHESKVLFLSSEHFILTQETWGKWQYLTKILQLLQFIKASKKMGISQSQSQFLYLQHRRAQLMDEDCLATPDPTTSMFLYWINTNRMGTAKNDFCNVFILKKHSFKKTDLYMWVSSQFQWARQTFQCIFRYSGNLPDCPGKRTAQKSRCNTKNMQHFFATTISGEQVKKNTCLPLF